MNKLLIISDIHVNDYKDYNFVHRQRLNNYYKYIKEVLKIAKENNCEYLAIAGDFIDTHTLSSYIFKVVKQAIYEWSRYFKDIYIILGQHDTVKTPNRSHIDSDSYVALECVGNIHYMDKKVIKLGNTEIAFMDWYKDQDLSWLDHKVDLFIGHLTISSLFGQEIDTNKFTEAICGDIHYPIDLGNLHSVGCQVQRSYSDNENTTCVVYDLDNHEWNRVPIDPYHELFMRLRSTNNEDESGFSKELNKEGLPKYYYRYQPDIVVLDNSNIVNEDIKFTTINEVINKLVTEYNLTKVHNKVLSKFDNEGSVDMNFELLDLYIYNFRSIREVDIDFTKYNGSLMIISPNGGGKTSIISAIYYALVNNNSYKDHITEGEYFIRLRIRLKYQNKVYTIDRSTEGLEFSIDGVLQSYNNKRECEADINERLPFINYIDSWFFNDECSSIFTSISNNRKIELLSTYYRLDVIDKYCAISESLKYELLPLITEKDNEISNLHNRIDTYNAKVDNLMDEINSKYDSNITLEDIDKEIVFITERIKSVQDSNSVIKSNKILRSNLLVRKTNILNQITNNNGLITHLRNKINIDENKESIDEILSKSTDLLEKIRAEESKISELNSKYSLQSSEIASIDKQLTSSSTINCPKCNESINLNGLVVIDTNELISKRKVLYEEALEIYNQVVKLNDNLTKLKEEYKLLSNRLNSLKAVEDSIKKLQSLESNNESLSKEVLGIEDELNGFNNDEVEIDIVPLIDRYNYLVNFKSLTELLIKTKSSENIEELTNKITTLNEEVTELRSEYDELVNYSLIFSTSGDIYEKVMEYLIKGFNSDRFKYEVTSGWYRGKKYLDISVSYKPDGSESYRPYWKLSKGQKSLCDLDALRNIITNTGLIVFDEFLKFMDPQNQLIAQQMINSMNSKLKIITLQNDNAPYINDRIFCEYDGHETKVIL